MAQEGHIHNEYCGASYKHKKLLKDNENYRKAFNENNLKLSSYLKAKSQNRVSNEDEIYTIPVVFHVLHTGGSVGTIYNPSDADIIATLDRVNEYYLGNNGLSIDIKIQFALAQRSPECQATSGIIRTDAVTALGGSNGTAYSNNGVGAGGVNDETLKSVSRWSNTDYYNIWIVNKIDGADGTSGTFTAGYAYFPGAPASIDGTIILATMMNESNASVLAHELGHSLNLYHTFEGDDDNSCPSNTNCDTDGDKVCDTPPHVRSGPGNCLSTSATNSCTGSAYGSVVRNIMDYNSCPELFSTGQKDRMRAALETLRPSLISSQADEANTGFSITAATCNATNQGIDANFFMGPIKFEFSNLTYITPTFSEDGLANANYATCNQVIQVNKGQEYPIKIQTKVNIQRVKAYIDYNNDGDFLDDGELVYSHMGSTAEEEHTGNVSIPNESSVLNTPLRMRILSDWFGSPDFNACSSLEYGQAEDYALIINNTAGESLAAPTNLQKTSISASTVSLSWEDNSNNEDLFEIYRSTTNVEEDFVKIGEVSANTVTYTDENLTPNTTYYYRVRARKN
ncbi:MAG: hypothetical protein OHK0038_15430 [Flammeovirgaceae bacterium]